MKGTAAMIALLAALPAAAQTTPVIPERFSLPPGNSQTPAPTPTPAPSSLPTPVVVPTLTPAPPPSVVPSLSVTRPTATATPAPRTAPSPRAVPAERPVATPDRDAPAPAPVASPELPPQAEVTGSVPSPQPAAIPTPIPDTAPEPAAVAPAEGWPWVVAGVIALLAAIAGVWLWRRRRSGEVDDPVDVPDMTVAVAPPSPSPPARPVARPAAAQATGQGPLTIDFRPQRLWTRGPDAFLAFEMAVTNAAAQPIDAVRPTIALASAGPDTAADVAAFRSGLSSLPGGEPFDLAPGETRVLAGEQLLPGGAMHVTSIGDREMIVPLVLVALRWRGGLSLASMGDAFLIGTGDAASAKLGPIWVDRPGQVYPRLHARRFTG